MTISPVVDLNIHYHDERQNEDYTRFAIALGYALRQRICVPGYISLCNVAGGLHLVLNWERVAISRFVADEVVASPDALGHWADEITHGYAQLMIDSLAGPKYEMRTPDFYPESQPYTLDN